MTAVDSARNTSTRVEDLPIDRIMPATFNPRKHFDQDALDELAASIRMDGVLEPIVVRTIHRDPPQAAGIPWYEIIAGERRWRASKLAGMETIPARIMGRIDDETALRWALIENLQRVDLDPIEEAEGYRLLTTTVGMKQREVAQAINRSQPAIANALRLLDLPEDVRKMIQAGKLSRSHGVALARYAGFPKVQSALADQAINRNLTSRQLEVVPAQVWRDLEQQQIVVAVAGFNTNFDISICERCPFKAYLRADDVHTRVCINPDHYHELEAEAKAKLQEHMQEVTGADPDGIVDVSQLSYTQYERIEIYRHPSAGCSEECPCRATGRRGAEGEPFQICTDPERFRNLTTADERRKKAEQQAQRQQLIETMEQRINAWHAGGEVTSREMAVIARAALHTVWRPTAISDTVKRHPIAGVETGDSNDVKNQLRDYTTLDRLPPADLVRLCLEAILREAISELGESHRPVNPVLAYYLGNEDGVA